MSKETFVMYPQVYAYYPAPPVYAYIEPMPVAAVRPKIYGPYGPYTYGPY